MDADDILGVAFVCVLEVCVCVCVVVGRGGADEGGLSSLLSSSRIVNRHLTMREGVILL